MRDYSKVRGTFWTGSTGKVLRGDLQAQVIAMYLMTSPHATMIGVFHCPIIYIAHETGSTLEGALKGLQTLREGGFCTYDEVSEVVWVHEMAKFQVDEELKPTDKRVKGIQKQYENMPAGPMKSGFYAKYAKSFHLKNSPENTKPLASPLQAPTKPEAGTEAEVNLKSNTLSFSQAKEDEGNSENEKPIKPKPLLANGKAKYQADAEIVLTFLNAKAKRSYQPVKVNLELIAERMKEGASLSDCRAVIAKKSREWAGTDMDKYLRPATLFNRTKFAQYVGELHVAADFGGAQ
jgi:uncharacterized phage protein (TIGR02220 family)